MLAVSRRLGVISQGLGDNSQRLGINSQMLGDRKHTENKAYFLCK